MDVNLKYSENLSETLNVLASKLGVETDKLFVTVKRQARVELYSRIFDLFIFIALFIVGCIGISYCYPYYTSIFTLTGFMTVKAVIISSVSVCFIIISIVSFLGSITEVITLWLNPDYWVLNNLLSKISN